MKNSISELRNLILTSQKQQIVFKFFSFFSSCGCLSVPKFKILVPFVWMPCSVLLLFVFCYFSTFSLQKSTMCTFTERNVCYLFKELEAATALHCSKFWMSARPFRIVQCSNAHSAKKAPVLGSACVHSHTLDLNSWVIASASTWFPLF